MEGLEYDTGTHILSLMRCWASRMKGELHPTENRYLLQRIFLLMDDSVNELIYFLVRPLPQTAMDLVCNCLAGALQHTQYVTPSSPLCGVKVLPAQK